MVAGIGIDLVHTEAFATQLADRASHFSAGTFTDAERRTAQSRPDRDPATHLAARFAAKEAFIKAWATARFGRPPAMQPPSLREIEVIQDAFGRPSLRLHGDVAQAFSAMGSTKLHLSLTHDGPMAAAVVIIEQISAPTNTRS